MNSHRGREAAQHFVSVARLLAEEYNEQAFVWCGYALARVVGWCALSLLAERPSIREVSAKKNEKKSAGRGTFPGRLSPGPYRRARFARAMHGGLAL